MLHLQRLRLFGLYFSSTSEPPPLRPQPRSETPFGRQVLGAAEHRATPVWPCSLCPRYHRAQAGGPGSVAERGLDVRFSAVARPHVAGSRIRVDPVAGRIRAPSAGGQPRVALTAHCRTAFCRSYACSHRVAWAHLMNRAVARRMSRYAVG